jgi:hypothetical protein
LSAFAIAGILATTALALPGQNRKFLSAEWQENTIPIQESGMSFFVAGCVLLLALLLGIAIDDASTGRRPEKQPNKPPFGET